MDWQPIETAPKEGEILLSDGEHVIAGEWDGRGDWYAFANGTTVWEGDGDRGGLLRVDIYPTHWMPLPPPPGSDDEFIAIKREQME